MSNEQLAAMLDALEDGRLAVHPNGVMFDTNDSDGYNYADVLNRVEAAEKLMARLKKVAQWAAKAPEIE